MKEGSLRYRVGHAKRGQTDSLRKDEEAPGMEVGRLWEVREALQEGEGRVRKIGYSFGLGGAGEQKKRGLGSDWKDWAHGEKCLEDI